MLTTNLSTRPFYNARAVRVVLAACVVLLVALTGLHVLWARSLRDREAVLSARATQAKAQAGQLLDQAAQLRAKLNDSEIAALSAAASEVNAVIEQRAFSWSRLLVHLESTLPPDVRVTSVQPELDEEGIVVSLHVAARSDEDLASFMNELERGEMFRDVLPVTLRRGDDFIEAVVRGTVASGTTASSGARPLHAANGATARDR